MTKFYAIIKEKNENCSNFRFSALIHIQAKKILSLI